MVRHEERWWSWNKHRPPLPPKSPPGPCRPPGDGELSPTQTTTATYSTFAPFCVSLLSPLTSVTSPPLRGTRVTPPLSRHHPFHGHAKADYTCAGFVSQGLSGTSAITVGSPLPLNFRTNWRVYVLLCLCPACVLQRCADLSVFVLQVSLFSLRFRHFRTLIQTSQAVPL